MISTLVLALATLATARPPSWVPLLPVAGGRWEKGTIPYPTLTGLEEEIAEQLREGRKQLEAALARKLPDAQLAEVYGELGMVYHAYALVEASAACYANAERLAPKDARWPYLQGVLLQGDNRLDEAAPAYGRALALIPNLFPALLHLAEIHFHRDELDEAGKLLDRALAVAPDSPAARALAGQIALSRREWKKAVDLLEGVLAAMPEANLLHHPLGLAYRGLGDLESAKRHLALAGRVGVRPNDPLRDAIESIKQGERLHMRRGHTAFNLGRYADAADEFRMALAARPESVTARVNLGAALAKMGDRQGAIAELRRVIELAPGNFTARFNLALLLVEDGKPREALPHLTAAVHSDPRDEAARMEEVRLAIALQELKRAKESLEEGLAALPASRRIAHSLARLLASCPDRSLRDGGRALELARAVATAEKTSTHLETLALALAQLGRCAEAAQAQREAIALARAGGDTLFLDDLEEALTRYKTANPCAP